MTAGRGARTRVLLVDDDSLARSALRMMLASAEDLAVVGEAADGGEVVAEVLRHRPDLVLMDIRMPRVDGLAATAAVTALSPAPRVLILTTFDLDEHVFGALKAGASGFLLKDTPPRELIDAVRVVAAGAAMLSPPVTQRLISHFAGGAGDGRRSAARRQFFRLTKREQQVLLGVGRGLSNAEIAGELHMSEGTVKAHVSHLLAKTDLANRVQAAILVHDAGLL